MRRHVVTATRQVNWSGLGQFPKFSRGRAGPGLTSMRREFSIVRVKASASQYGYPLSWDEVLECPLAGPFSTLEQQRLHVAVGCFPFARRTGDGRRAWRIDAPGSGAIVAWLTSDGSLFIEGETNLNLVYGLFVHLGQVLPSIAIEDRITGLVHNEPSLLRLVRREEAANLPWVVEIEAA